MLTLAPIASRIIKRPDGQVGSVRRPPARIGRRPEDPLPVDADWLTAAQFVADVITGPAVSPLVARAHAAGDKAFRSGACGLTRGGGPDHLPQLVLVERLLLQQPAGGALEDIPPLGQ